MKPMILRRIFLTLLMIPVCVVPLSATNFGKNKVQYQLRDWKYLQSKHFDVYYAEGNKRAAVFTADWAESCYVQLSNDLRHKLRKRIPIIIYGSHSQFQQTNIILDALPEGVGGFTELYKSRVVVPFQGSYDEFRHVLHHEMVHAMVFDVVYGNLGAMFARPQFNVPLWFHEGLAEFESLGWDLEADAFMIDAAAHGFLPSFTMNFGGFMVYKAGQSFFNFLANKYGREKIAEFLHRSHRMKDFLKAFKMTFGEEMEEVNRKWVFFIKQKYWPEMGKRDDINDYAKRLTFHPKDYSNFNTQPALSPDGKQVAFFSDRKDYTDIYIVSVDDKKKKARISSQEQAIHIESFHPFHSGIAWSPDGTRLLLVTQARGKEFLVIFDVKKKKQIQRIPVPLDAVYSPDWSPDGRFVVFSGIRKGATDIYEFELETQKMSRLTADLSCDRHPKYSPDGKQIAFDSNPKKESGNILNRNDYDLFLMNRDGSGAKRITTGPFDEHCPTWSSDGRSIVFSSNRCGLENLYLLDLDSGEDASPVTNVLGACQTPHWAGNSKRLVFSLYQSGGWDIYMIEDPFSCKKEGPLPKTEFAKTLLDSSGRFFPKKSPRPIKPVAVSDTAPETEGDTTKSLSLNATEPAADTVSTLTDTVDTSNVDNTVSAALTDSMEKKDEDTATRTLALRTDSSAKDTAKEDGKKLAKKTKEEGIDSLAKPVSLVEDTSLFLQDSMIYKTNTGAYRTHPYRLKFSPDMVTVGLAASTYYGGMAQGALVFSDVLGNHRIALMGDVYQGNYSEGSINVAATYLYFRRKVDYGFNAFYYGNETYLNYSSYYDRNYGGSLLLQIPFSMVSRAEFNTLGLAIDRSYNVWDDSTRQYVDDPEKNRKRTYALIPNAGLVYDNILWGITGPVNGKRWRMDLQLAPPFSGNDYGFWVLSGDFRRYYHLWKKYSFAFRLSGGRSESAGGKENPVNFIMGGDNNWLNWSLNTNNYDYSINTVYFSSMITPLRGTSFAEMRGNKYFLGNAEFRYPFIQNLTIAWPLPIQIRYVMGALFYDIGSAWTDGNQWDPADKDGLWFKLDDIRSGLGAGLRMNIGITILRLDRAWGTNMTRLFDNPVTYFSIGAEF